MYDVGVVAERTIIRESFILNTTKEEINGIELLNS